MKVFNFSIPTTGTEYYSVKAETLEEAIILLEDDASKYKDGDETDWDLGWGISKTSLENCLDDSYEVDEDEKV